ncbi:MAG TPA: ABC transporter ATP-binding protein [Acidimicrobiales bacterium]|nr:ABC transporter ATP-binding protein [Acidimicrobiales bacterium]
MFELGAICAGYGGSSVLHDVTVKVPDGSVAAVVGANGAGKTTLLRVASGLLRPGSGTVRLDGTDLTGSPPHRYVQSGVCLVPEGRGIFRSLSVRENLRLQGRPGRPEAEVVEHATEAFPVLGQRLDQLAGTMSGGEQQMLALARAYVTNPKVVLLDEVSMGLAPRVLDQIFAFLERLAGQGSTLVIVEQYVHRALALADFLYVLSRGSVVFCGEPGEVDVDDLVGGYLGVGLTPVRS